MSLLEKLYLRKKNNLAHYDQKLKVCNRNWYEYHKVELTEKEFDSFIEQNDLIIVYTSFFEKCFLCQLLLSPQTLRSISILFSNYVSERQKYANLFVLSSIPTYLYECTKKVNDDIFKNEKYLKLQNKWLNINNNKKCNVCEYNNIICNRGCLARSLVETNLTVPYSLYCLLLKELIPVVFEKLSDLSPEEFVNLNPNVKNLLIRNHYIPISILEKVKETINVLY